MTNEELDKLVNEFRCLGYQAVGTLRHLRDNDLLPPFSAGFEILQRWDEIQAQIEADHGKP